MNIVNSIASIVTIVTLFLLIGSKIILITRTKAELIGSQWFDYYKDVGDAEVYDEVTIDESNYNGPMCIRSSIGLRDIEVYRINDDSGDPLETPALVGEYGFLPANAALKINLLVPEGYPFYKIVATRTDFVKVEHEVSANGVGHLRGAILDSKFTKMSYLYYFFK